MLRFRLAHRYLVLLILFAFALGIWAPISRAVVPEDLTEGERRMVADHFSLMLAAERTREILEELDDQVTGLEEEIRQLEDRVRAAEETYLEVRSKTAIALRWIHRMGTTSYLEVLLGSASLREILRKAEVARAAARGALASLDEVRGEKRALDHLRGEIAELRVQLEDVRARRDEVAVAAEELGESRERMVESFGDEWPDLEAELTLLMTMWEEDAEPYLRALSERFARIAERGVVPENVTVETSLFSVRATVPEASLTALLAEEPGLEDTEFRFVPGEARLIDSRHRLSIRGDLEIDRFGVVTYRVSSVEFAGMPVEDRSILDAIARLELDLGPALGGMRPQGLTVGAGELELVLSFFS